MLKHNDLCNYKNGYILVLGMPMFRYEIYKQSMKLTHRNNKVVWVDMTIFEDLEHAITYALIESNNIQTSGNFVVLFADGFLPLFKFKFFGENFIVVENQLGEDIKVHKTSKLFAWLEYMGFPNCHEINVSLDNQLILQLKKDNGVWIKREIGCDKIPFSGDVRSEILKLRLENPGIRVDYK